MGKTARKISALSVSEGIFPPRVWQGALQTRERLSLLNQQWVELVLSENTTVSIYDCYPYLFLEAFPAISSIDMSNFSLALRLLASSVFHADKIMDLNPTSYDATATMSHIFAFQLEASMLFQQLFQPDSFFWQYSRTCFAHFFHASLREKEFASGKVAWKEYDEKTALDLAVGKASLSRLVTAGLAALSGDERLHNTLGESINLYNFAYQMFDDLCDWKEDYLRQSPSLLLCRWLPERPPEPKQQDLELMARELYYAGHACTVLQLAIDATERARILLSDLPDLAWHIVLTNLHDHCESLLNDIIRITQANRSRIKQRVTFSLELSPPQTCFEQLAWQGLQFLIRQWQLGFGEARDLSRFFHAQGFTGESEVQHGDIFQRAVIADILSEVSHIFQLDLQPILDYETNYLLEKRCHDGIGGWSYYPDLPEIPPDIDDLAQMIQLLHHTGRDTEITQYCEQALSTLLADHWHDDGSFETWIVPKEHRTPKQERQWVYTQTIWGMGADVDAMANLLYALALYDHARFDKVICLGTAYIEGHQQPDGSWESTWYHGPYYGTFVCVRLLAKVKPGSPCLDLARAFLLKSQLADGSWAMNTHKGDPLSTALALLSLLEHDHPGEPQHIFAYEKAFKYLQYSYDKDEQAWPRCEFIHGRLTNTVIEDQPYSYGSQTITTAFVLKAAAACHRLEAQLKMTS